MGPPAEIVAEHVHPDLSRARAAAGRRARPRRGPPGAALLDLERGRAGRAGARGPLAVCYHNVTPGHLLRAYNPALADDCDRARAALPLLARRASALIADSAFNAAELTAAGSVGVEVVPLLLDLPRAAPAPGRPEGPPSVISVGRVVPNKRLEDVIRAFTLYQRRHAPDATLTLLGGAGGFERYRDALAGLARRLGVRGVRLTGWVSAEELAAAYRGAHAYLCMSEHEGFCVPLVEAMAHGVPVVARDAGAVRETIGGAGLVLEHDLALASEALDEVVRVDGTRRALAAAAAARLRDLDPATTAARLRATLAPVLSPPA